MAENHVSNARDFGWVSEPLATRIEVGDCERGVVMLLRLVRGSRPIALSFPIV